jgi:uncharacterized membrane protein
MGPFRDVRDVLLAIIIAAIVGLATWVLNMSKWQGTIEERTITTKETAERIEALLRERSGRE